MCGTCCPIWIADDQHHHDPNKCWSCVISHWYQATCRGRPGLMCSIWSHLLRSGLITLLLIVQTRGQHCHHSHNFIQNPRGIHFQNFSISVACIIRGLSSTSIKTRRKAQGGAQRPVIWKDRLQYSCDGVERKGFQCLSMSLLNKNQFIIRCTADEDRTRGWSWSWSVNRHISHHILETLKSVEISRKCTSRLHMQSVSRCLLYRFLVWLSINFG